ncbi:DEAD/DEAH box helicase family protein [Pontibacter sp. G13]|uniref:DEAD/DEAH box helicase family protein n=1 Tax=Pontibacter sp. G13 TaxID=3074898 RepID=UPI00288AD4B7|nr:DEAD/DEAH box helicase family protein [Pontibacter sp. G13]WNJ21558.1 DEAD/DEAH box helicase family protein [Pontibacter sp. G13]
MDFQGRSIYFQGYLSNDMEALAAFMEAFTDERQKRYILQAPTGAGKTYSVFRIVAQQVATVETPLVFSAPLTLQLEQFSQTYSAPVVHAESTSETLKSLHDQSVILCTFDSLHRVEETLGTRKWRSCTVCFDEGHQLAMAAQDNYKLRPYTRSFQTAERANRIVIISATPHPYFVDMDFQYVQFIQRDTTPVEVIPVQLPSSNKQQVDATAIRMIALHASEQDQIQLVFLDSNDRLEGYRDQLIASGAYTPKEIALISRRARKDEGLDGIVYRSIVEQSVIPAGIRVILCTRILSEGISLNNEHIGVVHLIEVDNQELFAQFPARARKVDKIRAYSYLPERKVFTRSSGYAANMIEYKKLEAESVAQSYNQKYDDRSSRLRGISEYYDRKVRRDILRDSEPSLLIAPNYMSGRPETNHLFIFNQLIEQRDLGTDRNTFYRILDKRYPHISILPELSLPSEDELSENLKISKEQKRKLKQDSREELYDALIENPQAVFAAVATSDRRSDLVQQCDRLSRATAPTQDATTAVKSAMRHGETRPIWQALTIEQLGIPEDVGKALLSKRWDNKKFSQIREAIRTQQLMITGEVEPASFEEHETLRAHALLLDYFEGLEQEAIRIDALEAKTLLKEITGHDYGRGAIAFLRRFFKVDTRKGSYLIHGLLSLDGIYQDLSVSFEK